jgi:hypothetical protein
MHPDSAALIAYCDAETGAGRNRRIAGHLAGCAGCRERLRRIRGEKNELSAEAAAPVFDPERDLDAVRSAMAAWREGRGNPAASHLTSRLLWQLDQYFGAPAMHMLERPGTGPEELLRQANEMIEAFLGPEAGEAVRDDCLRGLVRVGAAGEAIQ